MFGQETKRINWPYQVSSLSASAGKDENGAGAVTGAATLEIIPRGAGLTGLDVDGRGKSARHEEKEGIHELHDEDAGNE